MGLSLAAYWARRAWHTLVACGDDGGGVEEATVVGGWDGAGAVDDVGGSKDTARTETTATSPRLT